MDAETFVINDGIRDISSALSPLLLVRGLDQLTTGDSLLDAFGQCDGLRRVLMIRERLTQMSSGFAFIEFWKASVRFVKWTV
jgi:RNA-binding protein 5/10